MPKEKEKIINASKLKKFVFCPYSYYLDKELSEEKKESESIKDIIPINAFAAVSFWLDTAFYGKGRNGFFRSELINESPEGKDISFFLRYKSPDSFSGYGKGYWIKKVITEKQPVRGRQVVWAYPNQWWKAAKTIEEACKNYYLFILENSIPVQGLIKKEEAFYFEGKKYAVRFGELRKNARIDEFGVRKIYPKRMDSDWEITLKILALCALAKESETYRSKCGLEELAEELISNNRHISPAVVYTYHDLARNEEYATTRAESDLTAMLSKTQEIWNDIKKSYRREKQFEPNWKNCFACRYNVLYEEKPVCNKRNPNSRLLMPMDYFPKKIKASLK